MVEFTIENKKKINNNKGVANSFIDLISSWATPYSTLTPFVWDIINALTSFYYSLLFCLAIYSLFFPWRRMGFPLEAYLGSVPFWALENTILALGQTDYLDFWTIMDTPSYKNMSQLPGGNNSNRIIDFKKY